MNLIALKLIFISAMLLISLIIGLLPLFLYRRWMKSSRNMGKKTSVAISLLSCLSGGVILSVSWLDILPDSRKFYADVEKRVDHQYKFAYVELFVGIGFFLVYLIEEIIGECFNGKAKTKSTEMDELKRSSSITQYDTVKLPKNPKDKQSLTNIFTFILALTFHMTMEGFLLGVQTKVLSLSSLFFGIILHKTLVMFSIGVKLARQLENRLNVSITFITLLAFSSPVSAVIGILVQNSFEDNTAGAIFSTVISALSVGTFMYIALFEIIVPERNAPQSKLLQWLACFIGFALMTTIIALSV